LWGNWRRLMIWIDLTPRQHVGRSEEAKKMYSSFLEIWKDSDPGNERVALAKKQLDKMKT